MNLRLSDLKKINGQLQAAQKILTQALDESGRKFCPTCKEMLPKSYWYEGASECKTCRIQRSLNRYYANEGKE